MREQRQRDPERKKLVSKRDSLKTAFASWGYEDAALWSPIAVAAGKGGCEMNVAHIFLDVLAVHASQTQEATTLYYLLYNMKQVLNDLAPRLCRVWALRKAADARQAEKEAFACVTTSSDGTVRPWQVVIKRASGFVSNMMERQLGECGVDTADTRHHFRHASRACHHGA